MYQIHVESVKNPKVYRVYQVFSDQTLFDLEFVIASGFDEMDWLDSRYEAKRKGGQAVKDVIYMLPEDDGVLDGAEEILSDWLVQPGDELIYCADNKFEARITLEHVLKEHLPFELCLAGEGSLKSPRKKKVDLEEINLKLSLKQVMQDMDFNSIEKHMEPDYETLLQLSDTLNKMKPWTYFENADIIALDLEEYEEVFYVAVMGAGNEEFGLMIYDELYGYELLVNTLLGKPVTDETYFDLSGFTVNFVDRSELESKDYQLIKDCGMSFRGKNKWIQFRSYNPGTFPIVPTFTDVELLKAIVQAMIQVTEMRMQGWEYPTVPVHTYPAFKVDKHGDIGKAYTLEVDLPVKGAIEVEITDIERAQFKRKPKIALQLEYDMFYLPYTVPSPEDEEQLIYPVVCVAFDRATGEVLYNDIMPFPKIDFVQQQMFWKLLNEMPVRPSKVFVKKEAMDVLGQLAKLLGVELVRSELPNVRLFKEIMENTPPFE